MQYVDELMTLLGLPRGDDKVEMQAMGAPRTVRSKH